MIKLIEEAKRTAAKKAIDIWVKNGSIIGIGSGSTVVYAVERLAQRVREENLLVTCVPSSFQAKQLIVQNNLVLSDLDRNPDLDCVIDGADEFDSEMNLIKGGGGCLLQEKIVANSARNVVIVADFTKKSEKFGDNWKKGIPIEVIPLAIVPVTRKIEEICGGKAVLRMAKMKAGPVVTDNGNFIVDWQFTDAPKDWLEMSRTLKMIPGVMETGLFMGMTSQIFCGMEDGTFLQIP